jgi:hypothetical protein
MLNPDESIVEAARPEDLAATYIGEVKEISVEAARLEDSAATYTGVFRGD